MKKHIFLLLIGCISLASCKKFLDINSTNPNEATSVTPALVLPQAIVTTAALTSTFNTSLADAGGQFANSGSANFSTSPVIFYNYTSADFTTLFSSTYRNVIDYQYIINYNKDEMSSSNFTAIARIMKSFAFARLVDQYNDVPYSDAFKGNEMLTPKYDKAEDIYKDLVAQLSLSIKIINDGFANNVSKPGSVADVKPTIDPMFKGDMGKWKSFANTLKLRLLIKMAGVPELKAYAMAEFAKLDVAAGFLTDDAVVNPGYLKEANKQNPSFNTLAFDNEGNRARTSRIPSRWIYSFYNGQKLNDSWRGKVIYYRFPNGPISQLGNISSTVPIAPAAGLSSWFTGTNSTTNSLGIAKGPTQSQVVMLGAESWFLQAEAHLRGYIAGDAETAFNKGVEASFTYLYKNVSDVVDATKNVAADVAAYKAANPLSYIVNWNKTATPLAGDYNLDVTNRRLEAIITQKYIALNTINCDEAYNEFRRTTYPYIVNGSLDPVLSFASLESLSSRADKLPSRIPYPSTEVTYNESNVPKGISPFLSRIFWDLD